MSQIISSFVITGFPRTFEEAVRLFLEDADPEATIDVTKTEFDDGDIWWKVGILL